jgi:Fe2+ transport system protein B
VTDTSSTWSTPGSGQAGVAAEGIKRGRHAGPPSGESAPNHIEQARRDGHNLLGGSARSDFAAENLDTAAKTPEQIAYERGQQDAVRSLTTPRMTGWRIICGICWAFWTLLFSIGALVSLAHGGFGSFLVGGILAGLAGWYDYRIWTLRARRLTLFIIF